MTILTSVIGNYERHVHSDVLTPNSRIQPQESKTKSSQKARGIDSVDISKASRELHFTKKLALSSPINSATQDRERKIEFLRQEISSGRYQVNFDKTAQKMIESAHTEFEIP